jgi:tetratricopeptide (TPR) repeat protein
MVTPVQFDERRPLPDAPVPDPGGGGTSTARRRPAPPTARRLVRWAGPLVAAGLLAAAGVRFFADPPAEPTVATPTDAASVLSGLEAAVAARPGDVVAWQQLARAYVDQATRTGDPAFAGQAADALDRAERLAPGDTSTALGRAALALYRHDFEAAREAAEAVLRQRPGNAEALAVLVDADVELGRYEQAAAYAQQLLDMRPGMAAFTRASYQRELRGDLDGALQAMVQAEAAAGGLDAARLTTAAGVGGDARSSGALATVVALQGDVLFSRGQAVEAAERYERALELAPDLSQASIGLARTEAAAGRYERAAALLDALVRRTPTLAAATLLADVQRLAGRPADGDELVDVIVQLQRSAGSTVDLELADHLANRGRPDVELARAAYRQRPSVYGADALGWTLTRAGRAAEALPYVEQSLSLGTADAALRFHAAVAFDATGDRDRARRELTLAFSTNPWFTFGLQAEATALAERLGVAAPTGWNR